MSYLQFRSQDSIRVADTGDIVSLGGFQPANNGELRHIVLNIYKHGTLPTATKMKMGLHSSSDLTTAYAFSDEFFVSTIENSIEGNDLTYWRAWVRFDFGRPNLNKNQLYYMSLQFTDYIRDADNFYIGVVGDDPNDLIYATGVENTHTFNLPSGKSVIAYQERT